MRSWLTDLFTGAKPKEISVIPIAPSLYSLSNKMDNSLLAVRDINHKYIVVGGVNMRSKNSSREKRGAIASGLFFIALAFLMAVVLAVLAISVEDFLGSVFIYIYIGLCLAVLVGVAAALKSRLKEISSGEDEETKKY